MRENILVCDSVSKWCADSQICTKSWDDKTLQIGYIANGSI